MISSVFLLLFKKSSLYYRCKEGDKMKKVSIIALHLGYGGIEKSISTLANLLVANSDIEVEIASVYELYDKPVFPLDERIKVKYLLEKGVKSNEKEWRMLFID